MTEERLVDTPAGPARLLLDPVPTGVRAAATLVLGHGAGGGAGTRDLLALARGLPPQGTPVVRVEQPWRVAGRKVAAAPAVLDVGWTAALAALAVDLDPGLPLVVGGRSAGARVACRTAVATGAAAVVAIAFPLHPPGRPEQSRAGELLGAGVPTLVVQGERDAFGGAAQVAAVLREAAPGSSYDLLPVPAADHGLRVPARSQPGQAAALEVVVARVAAFLEDLAAA